MTSVNRQVAPNRAREDRDLSQHSKTKRRGCELAWSLRVDEVKEFRLGQFRPVEANEREKRSTTRAEAEYKIALIFYDSAVKEAHFTISLGMGKIK
ncbi:hypothetical protein Lal_00002232 [Lupinus albus]|nr:hypothetical protein Lal_00002232 [Lupinus albus]